MPELDNDQVEVLQTIPAPSPAKPARDSKKLRIMHYKQKAHYFKKKFEGVSSSEIDDCSDNYYSSSEKERGMTYQFRVKNSDGSYLTKSNLDNRGKIAYHKVKDKTLLDFLKNKEREGCKALPLASSQTLYPRLTTFMDEEGMIELCKPIPERLRNELSTNLLLNEERKPLLQDKKMIKETIYQDLDSDLSVSDVSWSDNDRHLFLSGALTTNHTVKVK